jgi:hypothetical protein
MDPMALGASAVSLLAPYVGRLGGRLADRLGADLEEAVATRLERLYQWIKEKVTGDQFAESMLERLEERPNSQARQASLAGILGEMAQDDDRFAAELAVLVEDTRRAGGPTFVQITDAGAVAIHGNLTMRGTNIAGRDLRIGEQHIGEDDSDG